MIKRHLDKASARQAKYYNQNRREVTYAVADKVLRRNRVLSSADDHFAAKMAPRFVGPATDTKAILAVIYLMERESANKPIRVHVKDLKKYIPPPSQASTTADLSVPDHVEAESQYRYGRGLSREESHLLLTSTAQEKRASTAQWEVLLFSISKS